MYIFDVGTVKLLRNKAKQKSLKKIQDEARSGPESLNPFDVKSSSAEAPVSSFI